MSAWLVLPMKSLREGKTRLAPILHVTPRRALLERMFRHTLDQAALFPGLNRTLLLTRCTEARALAMEKGVRVLEEKSESGLNGGLRQAQLELRELNASKMLIVHCDLPLLGAEDLRRLAAAGSEAAVNAWKLSQATMASPLSAKYSRIVSRRPGDSAAINVRCAAPARKALSRCNGSAARRSIATLGSG